MPIFNKISEGIKIQIDSSFWCSIKSKLVTLLENMHTITHRTTLKIKTRIILILSWKKINSNIK